MKNQYLADINDYRKYGLLRSLAKAADLRLLVAWMLTPDDGGRDGGKRLYLEREERWRHLDPPLFDALQTLRRSPTPPTVDSIERIGVLPGTAFYSAIVPDGRQGRLAWRSGSDAAIDECSADCVFFDPDNGVEVSSTSIGRRNSSKYVFWDEIDAAWARDCSIIFYQHFPRKLREPFTRSLMEELAERTGAPFVAAADTSNVLFLVAALDPHSAAFSECCNGGLKSWREQFRIHALDQPRRPVSTPPVERCGYRQT